LSGASTEFSTLHKKVIGRKKGRKEGRKEGRKKEFAIKERIVLL